MSMEQETLIYVEENDKEEAKILTKGLLNKDVKSRAYINALGAELGKKYLSLENINNSKTYNLHNVHRILEEFDISDIMLSNIHIDVRVVFDENKIFIPKSHFEYEILPDIYLVFVLAQDSSHVKFLGFFEPKLINKNNQNSEYYFIEKEKLTSPLNLKAYVESHKGNTTQSLSDDINETAQTLMLSVADQNATKDEFKELLNYLSKSSYLRDRFIEFENFEILSYKAERSPEVTVPEEVAQEDIIDATIDDLKGAEAASDTVESSFEDVSEMFSEGSLPSMLDNEEKDEFADSQSDLGEPVSFDDTSLDTLKDMSSENADSVINFVDGNADDLFNELGLEDSEATDEEGLSFDNIDTSKAKIEMEEPFSEAIDFNSVEQSESPKQEELKPEEQMEVLDISNVDAIPNNLDENISETIEFNNIELANESPCINEINGEDSVPMLNMSDFSPLEPLPETISYNAESYDMDSLTITDNMMPLPKLDMAETSFEPVDIENLSINEQIPSKTQSVNEQALDETGIEEISSELDSIPDFGSDGLDLGLSDDMSAVSEEMPSDNLNLPSVDELDNLSVDDIVEEPVNAALNNTESPITDFDSIEQIDNFNTAPIREESMDESPVSDFASLSQVDEFEGVESASAEIPSIDEAMEADFESSEQIPEIGEAMDADLVSSEPIPEIGDSEFSDDSEEDENILDLPKEDDENDLTMLFNEGSDEEHLPEDFNTLNTLSQIPSVNLEKPKIPVKIVAVAAVAAVLAIGGIAGFSMKDKNAGAEPEPLAQTVPENQEPTEPIADNSNILANTPEVQTIPAEQKEPVNVKQDKPQVKKTASEKPSAAAAGYMGVTKLSWEVPDYLSYSANMKKYLQTAGKSIKLTLSSDLLLTTEYAYSNQMKVDLQLSSDGTLKDIKILKSSGSDQIDKIVLQTVKETLNVIKPTAGEVPTPEFRLALIINF